MFVHGFGDKVQALDAATGDLLWQYSRRLPQGARRRSSAASRSTATRLYVPTSDAHVVALDVKTGDVVWDHAVADPKAGFGMTGGPLVANGKVMVGTTGRAPGGNYIVALDAETGKEAWRFYAIARPGEPGGNSWNGLPLDKRNGGSVWIPGSYDPSCNLAFFGPAQTYDTGPLRNPSDEGDVTNDALYPDSTLAINPDTGKLAWFFQHQANGQWDLDWAFERQVMQLPVNGGAETVVVTGGKQMIFDIMEADTGKYLFSFDLGLQNVVTAIDPKTGDKIIDQKLVPGDGETKLTCPHAGGAKSWLPSSYNPRTKMLYVPIVEACMDLTPVGPGERGSLSTGVRWSLRPRPDSDGKYGRVQAINLETRKSVWIERQRAPQSTGHAGHRRRSGVRGRARSVAHRLRRHERQGAVADAAGRRAEQRADQLRRERPAVPGGRRRQRRRAGQHVPGAGPGDSQSAGPRSGGLRVRAARALAEVDMRHRPDCRGTAPGVGPRGRRRSSSPTGCWTCRSSRRRSASPATTATPSGTARRR